MKKSSTTLSAIMPFIFFVIFFTVYIYWNFFSEWRLNHSLSTLFFFFNYVTGCLIWLSLAWFFSRMVDVFFWGFFVEKKLKKNIPKFIKQLTKIVIVFVAFLGIIGVVFGKPITGILTASGLVGLVVGLSIKNIIADVFNGLAMNIDNAFRIGDYIFLHDTLINEIGKVLEVTWRSTRLETATKGMMVISNRKLSAMSITNLTKYETSSDIVTITLDKSIPSQRAIMVLSVAALSTTGVVETPKPRVSVSGISSTTITYTIVFSYNKRQILSSIIKGELLKNCASQLQYAAIIVEKESKLDPVLFMKSVNLFQSLKDDEWDILLNKITSTHVLADSVIVEQDDTGDSMFILVEGLLRVLVKQATSPGNPTDWIPVGLITSGQFFGEMSLLTGAPRSATVKAAMDSYIIIIPKDAMVDLFAKNPHLIEKISQVIVRRQEYTRRLKADWNAGREEKAASSTFMNDLVNKIKHFFGK